MSEVGPYRLQVAKRKVTCITCRSSEARKRGQFKT